MHAHLATINHEFCHALDPHTGERVFLHQTECDFLVNEARVGDLVDIAEIEAGPKGLRGRQVRWLERAAEETITGTVAHIDHTKKFGFIRPDGADVVGTNPSDADVMFHISSMGDFDGRNSPTFDSLVRGVPLTGVLSMTPRGRRAHSVWPA